MATHKVPITVRIEPQLLKQVRHCAEQDNRTLTNFIETALRERMESLGRARSSSLHQSHRRTSESGR